MHGNDFGISTDRLLQPLVTRWRWCYQQGCQRISRNSKPMSHPERSPTSTLSTCVFACVSHPTEMRTFVNSFNGANLNRGHSPQSGGRFAIDIGCNVRTFIIVITMCRPVTCTTCRKASWAGCGLHVEQVLRHLRADKRRQCHLNPAPAKRRWFSRS